MVRKIQTKKKIKIIKSTEVRSFERDRGFLSLPKSSPPSPVAPLRAPPVHGGTELSFPSSKQEGPSLQGLCLRKIQ